MEVEKGIAVSDSVLLIVHGSAYAVLSHHTLSSCPTAFLCLHQLVYLGVTGRTDTGEETESVQKYKYYKTGHQISFVLVLALVNIPSIESAEKEDDQTNNALSIPPLHCSWAAVIR